MADLPFTPAPPSTDNQTVILWVVAVLVVVLSIVVLALWRLMNRNQAECRDENKKVWGKCEEKEAEIHRLLTEDAKRSEKLANTVTEALERNTKVLAGLESGKYRTRHE